MKHSAPRHEPTRPPEGRIAECPARKYSSEPARPPEGRIPECAARRYSSKPGVVVLARGSAVAWLACMGPLAMAQVPPSAAAPAPAPASAPLATPARPVLELGLVLDGSYVSRALALGAREKGFSLGHTELTLGAAIDERWSGRATAAAHSHDGGIEVELEEAFVESTALPAGLQLRAGRFLSQVGYLNELHSHGDDFVERPLLYRAFLGNHYFDDGLRLNWVAPTRVYWRTGVELFSGRQLVQEAERQRGVGVLALNTRLGGDIGIEQSWQFGLSYLRNRLDAVAHADDDGAHDDDDDDHDEGDDHDHDHAHGASYTGRHLYLIDAVWKWAPGGNNRERQLRVSTEYARITDLNRYAGSGDVHQAWYVSAVYRFAPQWEAGLRLDELKVQEPHGDHFHGGRLQERSASLAWKRSHDTALRLQWTGQRNRGGFDDAVRSSVQVQYVMSLGAHSAHPF
jgi:hypothetical protein